MRVKKIQLQLFGILENGYILANFTISTIKDFIYKLLLNSSTKEEIAHAIDKARDISGFIKTKFYRPLADSIKGRLKRNFTMTFLKWLRRVTLKVLNGLRPADNVDNLNINVLEKKWFYDSRSRGELPFNLKYVY